MGTNVTISCSKCGYHRSYSVGCGFNHDIERIFYGKMSHLRTMVKNLEERIHIRNILFLHPEAKVFGSESRIYCCKYCNTLQENYYFRIIYGDEEHSPYYHCPRCETKMEALNTNWLTMCSSEPLQLFNSKGQVINLCCPECEQEELACNVTSFDWD